MAKQLFLNNFDWQFIAGVKALATTGTPDVELGYGILQISSAAAVFLTNPTAGDWYILTGFKRAGSVESQIEVLTVLGVDEAGYAAANETRIRVTRGSEDTSPQAYVAGDYISMRLTKGGVTNLLQASNNLLELTDITVAKAKLLLQNVDNTSNATERAAVATLTNKDLTVGTNTFPTFNQNTTGTAATVTGSTQASITSAANLITVGTITTGVWTGTDIAVADGGTGASTLSANAVLLGNGTSTLQTVAPSTSGNVLTSNGTTWTSAAITTLGTIATGVWNGTDIAVADGGTGSSTADAARIALAVETSATGSTRVVVGTTAQRDGSPAAGYLRLNTTLNTFEGYKDGAWGSVGGGLTGGAVSINKQTLTSDVTIADGESGSAVGPLNGGGFSITGSGTARFVVL